MEPLENNDAGKKLFNARGEVVSDMEKTRKSLIEDLVLKLQGTIDSNISGIKLATSIDVVGNQLYESMADDRENKFAKFTNIIKQKNAMILDGLFKDLKSKITIKCEHNHIFNKTIGSILNGQWCRECYLEYGGRLMIGRKNILPIAKEIAKTRGGECISEEYVNCKTKLKFRCANGHEWESVFNNIKKGTWCPICNIGLSERSCRYFLEELTGESFPKVKPEWLLSDKGYKMELDGYCEKVKLAFEYQCQQHYETVDHYQRTEKLNRRINNDELKKRLCELNGINLIIIPYTVDINNIPEFLNNCLCEMNLNMKLKSYKDIEIKYIKCDKLDSLHKLAESRNSKCLSNIYLGTGIKHDFICDKGHQFSCSVSNYKNHKGNGCPTCIRKDANIRSRKSSKDDAIKFAEKNNGFFLSEEFGILTDKYTWKCEKGHTFISSAENVFYNKYFCQQCKKENKWK